MNLRVHTDLVVTSQMLVEPDATAGDDATVYLLPSRTRYEQRGGGTETTTERRVIFSPHVPGHDVGEARDEWGMLIDLARAVQPAEAAKVSFRDAAAIRQGYGVMHGTCQGGMPTGVHAAYSIVRELDGREPGRFRFGYLHLPVSLGRRDAVVQFTRPDGSAKRLALTGRAAVWYKETVSSSPWTSFQRLVRTPAAGQFAWRRGGRYTR